MVTEKLEKSYDLWEKTETFGVEQRVHGRLLLYKNAGRIKVK